MKFFKIILGSMQESIKTTGFRGGPQILGPDKILFTFASGKIDSIFRIVIMFIFQFFSRADTKGCAKKISVISYYQ